MVWKASWVCYTRMGSILPLSIAVSRVDGGNTPLDLGKVQIPKYFPTHPPSPFPAGRHASCVNSGQIIVVRGAMRLDGVFVPQKYTSRN